MSTEAELSVITVLYGGAETLEKTLPSWGESLRGLPVEVVVVDNSPNSELEGLVERHLSGVDVTYAHREQNLGFAAGANLGAKLATTPRLMFLNADVYLTKSAFAALFELRDTQVAAIRLRTGGEVFAGVEMSWYGFLSDRPGHSGRACLGPSGGGGLFSRAIFEEFGGFDEDYFAWGEDAALAIRLSRAGVKTEVLAVELDHIGGHTVASLAGQRFKARLLARNRIWTVRRYFSRRQRALVVPFFGVALAANGLLRKLPQRTLGAYVRGISDGLLTTGDSSRAAKL